MIVFHQSTLPWVCVYAEARCRLLLKAARGDVAEAAVCYCDPYDYLPGEPKRPNLRQMPMTRLSAAGAFDWFTCEDIPLPTRKLHYHFKLTSFAGERTLFAANGLLSENEAARVEPFLISYRFPRQILRVPQWAGRSVWYQIFPDRFADHVLRDDAETFMPDRENFWGGTLKGVLNRLPDLRELGVTGVYLNPVFQSPSNHRYDTVDYTAVDARLGTESDLLALSEALHRQGMRLMLDGVFNHASNRCPQFRHALEHGKASPYWDWFLFRDEARARSLPADELSSEEMKTDPPYECFAFAANMPKWNTDNPAVIDYLTGIAADWTRKLRLDAWRLDVPDEISPRFLSSFRERVKAENPQVEIVGEIWGEPWPWLNGDQFDGAMNYPLYFAVRDFLLRGVISAQTFCDRINELTACRPPERFAADMNFIGNHDLPRALTEAGGCTAAVKAALLLLLLLPGEACLYYGDEVAMRGGPDPANRGTMRRTLDGEATAMRWFCREAIALRKQWLQEGFRGIHCEAPDAQSACIHLQYGNRKVDLLLAPETLRECADLETPAKILAMAGRKEEG
ncbi:MAG: glycoside hydrolase family 13 protein [Eubacteriales bacterium]|nr:glycoside hydrolase family 13 protein [Eubacteriales bacterium]